MPFDSINAVSRRHKKNPGAFIFKGFRGSEPGGIRTHDLLIRSQVEQPPDSLIYKACRICSCQTYGFSMVYSSSGGWILLALLY